MHFIDAIFNKLIKSGYGLVVEHVLAKDETGVRFSLPAQNKMLKNLKDIPAPVLHVLETLKKNGYGAYIVGGSLRDLILKKEPKDWDITTSATPGEIVGLFPKTVYENKYGTVAVVFEDEPETSSARIVEVTPYRTEGKYTDKRHPDEVIFTDSLEKDLERRDFTINAMAFSLSDSQVVDPYKGQIDLEKKIIQTVGDPEKRFEEDALRMLRAVRFACELGFAIQHDTILAISQKAPLLEFISWERKRDEFIKIILSPDPMLGLGLLQKLGLLKYVVPELLEGVGCEQKGEHIYDVFEHLLHALDHAAKKEWPLEVRLSALFHDIGKPKTRRWDGTKAGGKGKYTFYGHEVVGARMTAKILDRFHFSKHVIERVVNLVRFHMFFSDTETITLSAVRRTIANVGKDYIWELMKVRECDRVGMKKKEAPFRLRKYHAMIEQALRDPISVAQLKIDGERLIQMGEKPGPKFSFVLHALLEEVLEDPQKNTELFLEKRATELLALPLEELKKIGESGKEKKAKLEEEEIKKLHKKYGV